MMSGVTNGSWHGRNKILEEEDESDVEDSGDSDDSHDGVRARDKLKMMGLLGESLAEEDLIALELDDLDGGEYGAGASGASAGGAKAGPSASRKGKGPSRARRQSLLVQLDDSEAETDDDDFLLEVKPDDGKRKGDKAGAGADASTAIALSDDSDAELDFDLSNGGGGGVTNKIDTKAVVELWDDDDDDDNDLRRGAGSPPRTPAADNSKNSPTHRKNSGGGGGGDAFEDLRSPGGWSMPWSSPALHSAAAATAPNDDCCSPMSACSGNGGSGGVGAGSSRGFESPVPGPRSKSKRLEQEIEEEEDLSAFPNMMGDLDYAPTPSQRPSSPPTAFSCSSSPDKSQDEGGPPSPMEEEGNRALRKVVQTGRERARRWASDRLGISPIASSRSSRRGSGVGGGDSDAETTEDETGEETTVAMAGAVSKEASAAREKARNFGMELRTGSANRRRPSSSSSPQEGEDSTSEGRDVRDMEEEEDIEELSISYRSSDDSVDAVPSRSSGKGKLEDKGKDWKMRRSRRQGLDQEALREAGSGGGGRGSGGAVDIEDGNGIFGSSMMVDEPPPSSPLAANQDEHTESDGGTFSSPTGGVEMSGEQSGINGNPSPAKHSRTDCSTPPPVLAPTTPTPTRNIGGDVSTPSFPQKLFEGEAGGLERFGRVGPWTSDGGASTRSSYETAGSTQQQDNDERAEDENLRGSDGFCPDDGDVPIGCAASCESGSGSAHHVSSPDAIEGQGGDGDSARNNTRGREWGGGRRNREASDGSCRKEEPQSTPLPLSSVSAPTGGGGSSGHGDGSGRYAPAPATACPAHVMAAEKRGFTCRRCRCAAGAEAAEKAGDLLLDAWEKERSGDAYGAMGLCLEAIKLCDEDKELHKTIARIGSRLGCLS